MSMEKMMTSLITKDQDEFNAAFDSEVKSRISKNMPSIAQSVASQLVTGGNNSTENTADIEPENTDTINIDTE